MLPTAAVREKARTALRSRLRRWLTDPLAAAADSLTVALHPPTEKTVAHDPDAARDWVRGWHRYGGPGDVDWEPRRWPSFGTQDVPVRVRLTGADQITEAAGDQRRWRLLRARRDALAGLSPSASDLPAAIAAAVSRWEILDDADFDRLIATASWLLEHPHSGLLIRQLPVEGVDTKWLGRHRRLVEALIAAVRGETDLGIRTLPALHEIAVLDPALLPGVPRIFAASVDGLAALPISPTHVLILENKEGVYALPSAPGTVALYGGGNAVTELARLPWLGDADVVYWGDLDSHGLTILDRFRARLPGVRSVMMDTATLTRWRHLGVTEPVPADRETGHLTETERRVLDELLDLGLRVEQERIPWPYALDRLRAAGISLLDGPVPGDTVAG